MVEQTSPEAVAVLSSFQREYLRLVHQGMTSKQIALQLGGSHHTINAEIAKACRILAAPSRIKAAEWLVAYDAESTSYERSYDPMTVAPSSVLQPEAGRENSEATVHQSSSRPAFLPFVTAGKPVNELSIGLRLAWILVIAVMTAILAVGLLGSVDGTLRRLANFF